MENIKEYYKYMAPSLSSLELENFLAFCQHHGLRTPKNIVEGKMTLKEGIVVFLEDAITSLATAAVDRKSVV